MRPRKPTTARTVPTAARALMLAAIAALALFCVPQADADIAQPTVVSANPVDFTPHVLNGTVWAIAVVGDTVVVGGDFTSVANSTRTQTLTRRNIFAFGLHDGVIKPFAPTVDGPVYALAAGALNTVYVGGAFHTVGGVAQRGLARLAVLTGARVGGFVGSINWGDVRALAVNGARLYAGGTFSAISGVNRTALARLNASTGLVDSGFNAKLSAPGLDRTRVEDFALSPDGRHLVVVGAILKVALGARVQIALLDVSGPAALLTSWYTDVYRTPCMAGFDTYLRGVDFSPDGAYFVVVSTGRSSGPTKMCDSAARFEVAGTGLHNPTWVNRTGGDSLYSVSVTGAAVYVAGHQRYMDNPYGSDANGPGPGAVARKGIAAISPQTGHALPWNPTRTRGEGARALVATSTGLLVGSDTEQLGHEFHGRVGMFPLP